MHGIQTDQTTATGPRYSAEDVSFALTSRAYTTPTSQHDLSVFKAVTLLRPRRFNSSSDGLLQLAPGLASVTAPSATRVVLPVLTLASLSMQVNTTFVLSASGLWDFPIVWDYVDFYVVLTKRNNNLKGPFATSCLNFWQSNRYEAEPSPDFTNGFLTEC
ncbi:hypothetical protein DL98DRAFT_531838 [Cadophora sp. DSE1049]|nr:hypothetical protein DL98DRAFT_531838 [Cadophora sp. DSE1049]